MENDVIRALFNSRSECLPRRRGSTAKWDLRSEAEREHKENTFGGKPSSTITGKSRTPQPKIIYALLKDSQGGRVALQL